MTARYDLFIQALIQLMQGMYICVLGIILLKVLWELCSIAFDNKKDTVLPGSINNDDEDEIDVLPRQDKCQYCSSPINWLEARGHCTYCGAPL